MRHNEDILLSDSAKLHFKKKRNCTIEKRIDISSAIVKYIEEVYPKIEETVATYGPPNPQYEYVRYAEMITVNSVSGSGSDSGSTIFCLFCIFYAGYALYSVLMAKKYC